MLAMLGASMLGICVFSFVVFMIWSIIKKLRRTEEVSQTSIGADNSGRNVRTKRHRKLTRNGGNNVVVMNLDDNDEDEDDDKDCGTTLSDDENDTGVRCSENLYLEMNREDEGKLYHQIDLHEKLPGPEVCAIVPNVAYGHQQGVSTTRNVGGRSEGCSSSLEILCNDDILRVVDNTFADADAAGMACIIPKPPLQDIEGICKYHLIIQIYY